MLAKRAFDVLAASLGLLLLSPLLAALALWIRCDSPGPVLFRQTRIGRHGRPFTILKLRTMHCDAAQGCQLSVRADPRVTRAGAALRRYKLDELPQLLNVLRGEMSLVGPRPEVARYVACYPEGVRDTVLSVAPGITDWAAIHYRDENDLLESAGDPERVYREQILPIKLDYYQRYVRTRSFGEDLRILLATAGALCLPVVAPRHWRHTVIDLLRGLAALEVAAAHLRAITFPGMHGVSNPPWWLSLLAFGTGFAHQAVVVFFVLSGWLVGGGLLARRRVHGAYQAYAIDRVSRLWTVLVPGLLLMAVLAPSGTPDTGWGLMLGNLFGWQGLAVPVFAGNFPLWSLANESAYYLLFPLLLAGVDAERPWRRAACITLAALWAALAPAALSLYFLVWGIGAAASQLRLQAGSGATALAWSAFALLAVALRIAGWNDDLDTRSIVQDLVYGAMFALCLALIPERPLPRNAAGQWLARVAAGLAAISFTLYVMHLPLIGALQPGRLDPYDKASLLHYLQWLALVLLGSGVCYALFEAHTARVRAWLKRRLLP